MKNFIPTILGLALFVGPAPAMAEGSVAAPSPEQPFFVNFHNVNGLSIPVVPDAEGETPAPTSPAAQPAMVNPVASPAAAPVAPKPFEEKAAAPDAMPKFLRIDAANYNLRTTEDFNVNDQKNVGNHAPKGALYAIIRQEKLRSGTAVQIYDHGEERWVFVPNWRKGDFDFCESEACFSDINRVLKIVVDDGMTPENLAQCGIPVDENGDALVSMLPNSPNDVLLPVKRAKTSVEKLDKQVAHTQDNPAPAMVESAPANKASAAPAPLPPERPALPAKLLVSSKPKAASHVAEVPYGAARRGETRYNDAPAPMAPLPNTSAHVFGVSAAQAYTALHDYLPRYPLSWDVNWDAHHYTHDDAWSKITMKAVYKYGKDLINTRSLADAPAWCPRYSKLDEGDRAEMWAHLISAIARPESGFNPTINFDEKNPRHRPTHGPVNPRNFSQGLLMLSYASAGQPAYSNFCHFDWNKDRNKDVSDPSLTIYDAKKQIECAVGIMNAGVRADGRIGSHDAPWARGGARFWSTLRDFNPLTKMTKAELRTSYPPCFGGK